MAKIKSDYDEAVIHKSDLQCYSTSKKYNNHLIALQVEEKKTSIEIKMPITMLTFVVLPWQWNYIEKLYSKFNSTLTPASWGLKQNNNKKKKDYGIVLNMEKLWCWWNWGKKRNGMEMVFLSRCVDGREIVDGAWVVWTVRLTNFWWI